MVVGNTFHEIIDFIRSYMSPGEMGHFITDYALEFALNLDAPTRHASPQTWIALDLL